MGQLREENRSAADRLEESEAVQRVHAGRVIDLKKEVRGMSRRGEEKGRKGREVELHAKGSMCSAKGYWSLVRCDSLG